MYIAHSREDGATQSIFEHLQATARLARQFGEAFGAGELAEQAALLHDIGKFSDEFQLRITGGGHRTDHSTAGAQEAMKLGLQPAAFCIAGHHTGLPDGGNPGDPAGGDTLISRIKKQVEDYSAFRAEIAPTAVPLPQPEDPFEAAFFTRMLYSCLVDADFLDTEAFMQNGKVQRGAGRPLAELKPRLDAYLSRFDPPTSPLNQKRTDILHQCIAAGDWPKGLYTLTVPTGGGKTLSSMAYALQAAVTHGMDRIIYVIPYISIIEQTAALFDEIFGPENVLQHHSDMVYDENTQDETQNRLRLAAENFDAPIVVTTNVQFFESLFANRSSRCRKLHNFCNSVIVFDEAQMIPLPFLEPCCRAISSLVRHYGASAVLCTATQPALEPYFPATLPVREICPDTKQLYQFFKRTHLKQLGEVTAEQLAAHMEGHSQCLAIVNTRAQAAQLFELLPREGAYHLSTLMTPVHRRRVLAEIRARLEAGLPCRVAATSLVEAGVDLDFPAVYRAKAGLDSVLQAAGRCNRNGKDLQGGSVYLYSLGTPPRMLGQNLALFQETLRFAEQNRLEPDSPEAIAYYFNQLHGLKDSQLDMYGVIPAFLKGINGCMVPFATVAQTFKLIDTPTKGVLIPLEEGAELAARLRAGEWNRTLLRQAGRYTVNIYPDHWNSLAATGASVLLTPDLAILQDLALYHEATGLCPTPVMGGDGYFV